MNTIEASFFPVKQRRFRRRGAPSGPASLNLTLAIFHVSGGGFVNLTFDRAVDVTHFVPSAIQVSDGVFNLLQYQGSGVVQLSSVMIKVTLTSIGSVPAGSDLLSATAASGLVAVDDGGMWAGCSNVVLPFS